MSQKLIIVIMGAVILAGGGAWYYQTNIAEKDDASGSKSSTREADEDKNEGIFDALKSGSESFEEILRGSSAQECKFAGVDPETKEETEGTIFVKGESFKLKADTKIEGEESTINMIQHEMVMYIWSDGEEEKTGMKLDVSMFEGMESDEKPESPIDWLKDPESNVKYSCKGWSPRGNSFEPPEDIVFMDMFGGMGAMFGEMMQEGMMGEADASMEASDEWSY